MFESVSLTALHCFFKSCRVDDSWVSENVSYYQGTIYSSFMEQRSRFDLTYYNLSDGVLTAYMATIVLNFPDDTVTQIVYPNNVNDSVLCFVGDTYFFPPPYYGLLPSLRGSYHGDFVNTRGTPVQRWSIYPTTGWAATFMYNIQEKSLASLEYAYHPQGYQHHRRTLLEFNQYTEEDFMLMQKEQDIFASEQCPNGSIVSTSPLVDLFTLAVPPE